MKSTQSFEAIREGNYPAVAASPFLRACSSTRRIMLDVWIALLPAVLGSIFFFGSRVLAHYGLCILTALITDIAIQKIRGKAQLTFDASPLVTGTLLAMSMPVSAPLWFGPLGAVIAILVAKELFGGIGRNFLNPALAGRAVLRILFETQMTQNPAPRFLLFGLPVDTVSGATPLALLKSGIPLDNSELLAAFLGDTAGKLGETSAVLLLIGAAYLLIRGVIRYRIPVAMLGTVAVIAVFFGGPEGFGWAGWRVALGHLLGGATILGAFFMATDYGSSPSAPVAQWMFGIGLGFVLMLFRLLGSYPEGFTFAALILNCTVPLLNRWIRPRVLGERRKAEPAKA